MQANNLRIIPTLGDGRYLFSAFSVFLTNGDAMACDKLRVNCVTFMQNNSDLLRDVFITSQPDRVFQSSTFEETYVSHMLRMERSSEYGTMVEVTSLLHLFQVNLVYWTVLPGGMLSRVELYSQAYPGRPTITLLYIDDHFDLVCTLLAGKWSYGDNPVSLDFEADEAEQLILREAETTDSVSVPSLEGENIFTLLLKEIV